ncbi:MAG: RCC1 repeat-containing protein, partial [Oligoflexia bacterium]|nr:RCC1 repeat-containing protein [Oligoflexia bacterium]
WAWGMNTNEQHGTGDGGTVGSRSLPVQVSGVGQSCTSVSAGNTHSFALASDGTLWVWGYGTNGQLGLGVDISTRSTPVLMAGRTWSRTLASNGYSAGIDSAGSLWAWGTNTAGRLGIQEPVEATNISSPVQVGIETGWTEIAGGLNFVAGIRNGALWAWGNNDYGQLGNGQSTLKRVPTVFPGGPFLGISAGSDESFFIRPDGTLWGSGANLQYQLGQSDSLKRLSPCQIGSMTSVAWVVSSSSTHSMVIEDGNLWTWGGNGTALGHNDTLARSSPQQLGSATDWQRCAAGGGHSLAIRSKTLWSWGGNGFGQIGDSTNVGKSSPVQIGALTDWVSVSAGAYHSLAIREATPDTGIGTLWSFGLNGSGQLGISNLTSMNSPVQIGAGVSWSKVAAGLSHSLALRVDGSLWAWGLNSSGQLGLSDLTQRTSPVQVGVEWAKVAAGSSHALALKTNGTLWSWGANGSGQLGLGIFDTAGRSSPVQIGTDTNWVEISCGRIHSMAMKNDGSVWLWGDHTNGRLGFGPLSFSSPVQVGTDTNWAKVQAGEAFTIAQKLDGTLWSWGYNLSGQLGHHSGTCFSSPVQIGTEKWEKFSCRGNHVLALKK